MEPDEGHVCMSRTRSRGLRAGAAGWCYGGQISPFLPRWRAFRSTSRSTTIFCSRRMGEGSTDTMAGLSPTRTEVLQCTTRTTICVTFRSGRWYAFSALDFEATQVGWKISIFGCLGLGNTLQKRTRGRWHSSFCQCLSVAGTRLPGMALM